MSPPSALDAVERNVRSSFFDTVDDEALTQIVQWASCLCSFTGQNQVHPPEQMFDVNGPFFPLMGKTYCTLVIIDGYDYHYDDSFAVQDSVLEPFVISPSLARRVNVIKCLGSKLEGLRFHLREMTENHDRLAQDVLQHCKDLKSLKFYVIHAKSSKMPSFVRQLINAFSHSIEEIYIRYSAFDGRFSRFSDCLFPKLKSLSLLDLSDLDDTILPLQNVGDCLERLRLTNGQNYVSDTPAPASKWRELFEAVRANCAGLCSISISGMGLPREDYEQLLVSFEHQLRSASFREYFLSEPDDFESINRVGRQCPNVEFSIAVDSDHIEVSAFPTLSRLASHVNRALFYLNEDMSSWEAFEGFANRLDKLKIVKSLCRSTKTMHALFATPKPVLEILLLHCSYVSLSKDPIAAGKMKSSISNVRIFTFNVFDREDVGLYATLFTACTNLRRARVYFHDFCSKEEALDYYNRLFRALRDCKKLEYVTIQGFINFDPDEDNENEFKNRFKDAQLFRFRGVHITVEGIEMFAPSCHVIFEE